MIDARTLLVEFIVRQAGTIVLAIGTCFLRK